MSCKRSNINPIPKVDIPKEKSGYRGINITPVIARAFEKVVYNTFVKEAVEENLSTTQFAYRESGNCTSAPLTIQHFIKKHLDNLDCEAVRVFAMDFSKAFDSVRHELLSNKLKWLPLNAYIINWYHSFLYNRQQPIVHNNHLHECKGVNKGTTQNSMSGPYLFNVFLNDLEIKLGSTPALFKYADDSTIVAPVWKGGSDTSSDLVEALLTWANCNSMSCNPDRCKELVIKKKRNSAFYPVVRNIPQHATLDLLGLTFQNDCKFSAHIKAKLCKANKCLHVLRVCRKERYSQTEIDYLFYSIVLPNITYGLSVYGASVAKINVLQQFLDRC